MAPIRPEEPHCMQALVSFGLTCIWLLLRDFMLDQSTQFAPVIRSVPEICAGWITFPSGFSAEEKAEKIASTPGIDMILAANVDLRNFLRQQTVRSPIRCAKRKSNPSNQVYINELDSGKKPAK
jgi:hypothetical protein